MTGFFGLFLGLDIFWNQILSFRIKILLLLSLRRVQKFLVVTQVLILVPREGKNLFCPSDLEFLSLTAKNVEFLSLTLKNLEVFGTKQILTLPRDQNQNLRDHKKFLYPPLGQTLQNFDSLWQKSISKGIKAQKRPKNPVILPPQKKKPVKKPKKFFLVSEVFILCEFVFLYIPGEKHDKLHVKVSQFTQWTVNNTGYIRYLSLCYRGHTYPANFAGYPCVLLRVTAVAQIH